MMRLLIIIRDGVRIFRASGSFDRAAAISFYALFSIIPLMLLITAGLGFILGTHSDIFEKVVDMTRKSLPYLSERIVKDLAGLSRSWKAWGWLSLIMLLLSAELVLDSAAAALTDGFDVRTKFGFFRKKLVNFAILLVALLTALASILVTAAANILLEVRVVLFGVDLSYYLIEGLALTFILPFVLMVVSVTFVFKMFSGSNLSVRFAFYGSLFFASIWEVSKYLFAFYISNFAQYNKFYGSLSTVMILLLWLFFSANIFLFSASLARAAYK